MDVSATPLVRNDYVQALHHALLRTCGVAATQRFWRANPLHCNGLEMSPGAIARHLTDPAKTSPLAWVFHSQNAIESFLLDYGVPIDVFFDSLLNHANRASFVHSRTGLAWVSPLLGLVFRVADPYRALIKLAKLAGRSISPSMIFREFGLQKHADGRRRILVLTTYRELWDETLPAWDGPVFSGRFYGGSPKALGLEPFDPVEPLADARSAQRVVGGPNAELRDSVFSIDGVSVGHVERFSGFCARRAWSLPDYGQPDPEVVVMDQDWLCPRRKRIVLHAGCAYGAPVYLFALHWRVLRGRRPNLVQHLMDDALSAENGMDDARTQALVQAFMALEEARVRCVYVTAEKAVYVDGQYLCKGVPALILRYCLRAHCSEQRDEFTFREFKRDSSFISHPKNTGFEVRLRRLREVLATSACGLRIEPTGPGRFALRGRAPITLEERA